LASGRCRCRRREAMTEKPLHVRVAEALGCRTRHLRNAIWLCGCDKDHNSSDYGGNVPPYDTDWSATGPLIEKYKIMLWPWNETAWCAERRVDLGVPADPERPLETGPSSDSWVKGETPLIAVCNLILWLKEAGKL